MLKVLIVGSDKIFAIENFYVKYLRDQGVDVRHFAGQSDFNDYYQKNYLNKILFKAGFSGIYRKINKEFKRAVNEFSPDIIWVFKGMEIYPETLQWAINKNIPLVNYNPDNPFLFSGKGSGNRNITNSIGLYNLHFTYNLAIQKKLEETHNAKAVFLPFAFDVSDEIYNDCRQQKEILRCCFIGNPDVNRAAFIKQLAAEVQVDVYGNNWDKFIQHPSVKSHLPVYGKEQWETLYKYRVQLNLMRVHNDDSHNMRSFEVPGIGSIQLAPSTAEHKIFFTEGEDIFMFSGIKECIAKAKYILGLTEKEALVIRNRAALNVRQKKHTYKDRSVQALQGLKMVI